ncbi:MAG TPA: YceI family protein [Gemmatimonadaceae bacterium]|nr:YceI family protein [Gemmatimonadaceae bacterium]
MRKTLLTVSALLAATATAGAQSASAIRLRLDPASELTIEGTSSLHDFHCKTNKLNAYVDVDPGYTKDLTKVARPIAAVKVNIVVKTLTCGNGQMDRNMYNTLKADENQLIKYTLSGYDILDGTASPSAFTANTTGTLVVAGQEKPIAMKINAERLSDGKAVAQGEQKLRMSDFGISPPSFMFGRLRVGDQIKVKFNLKAGPELLAQLAAVFNRVGE